MKKAMQKWISSITILCLLAVSLTGCGSKTVTEVTQTGGYSPHGTRYKAMEIPQPAGIPAEDVQILIQAGLDAAAQESDLWELFEITDTDILKELMQDLGGKRERREGENFDSEVPEMPANDNRGRPDGTLPQRNGRSQDEGTFPEGELTKNVQNRSESGRQPVFRGGGMASRAIVISGTENTSLEAEDIFTHIQLAAEEMNYQVSSMELTEEQQSVIETSDGHSVKLIVLINTTHSW